MYAVHFATTRVSHDRLLGGLESFRVLRGDEYLFLIDIEIPYGASLDVLHSAGLTEDNGQEQLKLGLRRYGLLRIEQGLRDEIFPVEQTEKVQKLSVSGLELPLLIQLITEKTCDYQTRRGRDLFCTAAGSFPEDTTISSSMLPRGQPTSRPVCQTCDLPSTDIICSHLMHAVVKDASSRDAVYRKLLFALCDLGHDEAKQGAKQCQPGGHDCWERLIPPASTALQESAPLALPDALDALDDVWRLVFGKKKRLVRINRAGNVAALTQPCATREEFESRMSSLADILKSFEIPDTLLPADHGTNPDQTFDRLALCLSARLDEGDRSSAEAAIKVLRRVNAVRRAAQHSGAALELPKALGALGVSYPLVSFSDAWATMQRKTSEALAKIRGLLRASV